MTMLPSNLGHEINSCSVPEVDMQSCFMSRKYKLPCHRGASDRFNSSGSKISCCCCCCRASNSGDVGGALQGTRILIRGVEVALVVLVKCVLLLERQDQLGNVPSLIVSIVSINVIVKCSSRVAKLLPQMVWAKFC